MDVETILTAYVAAALWSSTDEDGTPLDEGRDADDLAPETVDEMREDVRNFLELVTGDEVNLDLGSMTAEQFGHDFWLTRNHHGAGFWDRGLGDLGDKLTHWAHTFGSVDLYVGDDGKIHS